MMFINYKRTPSQCEYEGRVHEIVQYYYYKPRNLTGSKIKQNLQNINKRSSAKDLLKHRFSRKIRVNPDFEINEALIVKLKYKQKKTKNTQGKEKEPK